jgi:hypothetical protein
MGAFDELNRSIDLTSTCSELEESTDDTPVYAHLFAIPVILEVPNTGLDPIIGNTVALRAFEQSISSSGLADGDPEVRVLDYLYTQEEIFDLSFSQVYALSFNAANPGQLTQETRHETLYQMRAGSVTDETVRQTTIAGAARIDRNILLRFIVGVFIDRTLTDPFETAYDSEEGSEDMNRFARTIHQWQLDASDIVRVALGKSYSDLHLRVGSIDSFCLARRLGSEEYKQHLMLLQMHETLGTKGLDAQVMSACLAPYGNTEGVMEIRVGLRSLATGAFCTGLVYELSDEEDAGEACHHLSALLSIDGVFSVHTLEEVQEIPLKPWTKAEKNFPTVKSAEILSFDAIYSVANRTLH